MKFDPETGTYELTGAERWQPHCAGCGQPCDQAGGGEGYTTCCNKRVCFGGSCRRCDPPPTHVPDAWSLRVEYDDSARRLVAMGFVRIPDSRGETFWRRSDQLRIQLRRQSETTLWNLIEVGTNRQIEWEEIEAAG